MEVLAYLLQLQVQQLIMVAVGVDHVVAHLVREVQVDLAEEVMVLNQREEWLVQLTQVVEPVADGR
jgi:hypothetical protein